MPRARVIVLGNEKGGSGKSTTAVHVAVGLLRMGQRIATLDLDARQGTLSRYLANRERFAEKAGGVPLPTHERIAEVDLFEEALLALGARHDAVIVDCPGHDSPLARLAHSHADTLITPLNDSFVDLDVLARVDDTGRRIAGLSHYAEMVWEQRKVRAMRDGGSIDWIVMRNRLSSLDAHNRRDMANVLGQLAGRIGFRQVAGLGERVVFRELFPRGLTLLDLREAGEGGLTMSHLAARQEVRGLIEALLESPYRKAAGL